MLDKLEDYSASTERVECKRNREKKLNINATTKTKFYFRKQNMIGNTHLR